jgi:alcohol dehydrogenase (cytochrome c)
LLAVGFGFITPGNGGEDRFAHLNQIQGGGTFKSLRQGQKVEFIAIGGAKGDAGDGDSTDLVRSGAPKDPEGPRTKPQRRSMLSILSQHAEPFTQLDASQPGRAPPVASNVDASRLAAARSEPGNWMTYYGAYDGQRFSGLDQINPGNVKSLKVAWVFQAGVIGLIATPATYALEAAPIVVDGVMFVSGWDGYVWALDASSGKVFWRYRHAVPLDVPLCCGNVNRGVAVALGKVFFVTPNGYLVALDAATGKRIWQQPFVDPRAGESATLAPLVIRDKILVGNSGAEYGVRGHIDAFDLETGRRIWRHYTIPKPGEPGAETWPSGRAWERGGGAAWITGSYDPELDLVYWSRRTANGLNDR